MKSMHHSSLNDWDHFKLISKFVCKAGAVIASYRKSGLVTANLLISIFIKIVSLYSKRHGIATKSLSAIQFFIEG